jgi:hypothetical protein
LTYEPIELIQLRDERDQLKNIVTKLANLDKELPEEAKALISLAVTDSPRLVIDCPVFIGDWHFRTYMEGDTLFGQISNQKDICDSQVVIFLKYSGYGWGYDGVRFKEHLNTDREWAKRFSVILGQVLDMD